MFESQSGSLSHLCVHSSVQHDCGCEEESKKQQQDSDGMIQRREQSESQVIVVVAASWPLRLRLTVQLCTPLIPEKQSAYCSYSASTVHHPLPLQFTQTHTYSNVMVRHGMMSLVVGDREHLSL